MAKDTTPAFFFEPERWFTPNTYNHNFADPPPGPGVYLLVKPDPDRRSKIIYDDQILYVGSSKNLWVRYNKHTTLRLLKQFYGYVQFYWRPVPNYLEVEKQLIQLIQPEHNKQWR